MSVIVTDINEICESIKDISRLHAIHSESWLKSQMDCYNLKSKRITDICDSFKEEDLQFTYFNQEYISSLNDYCNSLNDVFNSPFYEFLDWPFESRSRIKDPDSRLSKIIHYRLVKNEKGRISINKCLNDLLGFRIIVNGFDHTDESRELLNRKLNELNIKIHNSSKLNYKATHIYFSNGNNKCYPWEMQIWDKNDVKNNLDSHLLHKQGYTNWAENFMINDYVIEEAK